MQSKTLPQNIDVSKQIPVILKLAKLKKLTHTVLNQQKLCFKYDAPVHTLLRYVQKQLKQDLKSTSFYILSQSGQVISPRMTFSDAYEKYKNDNDNMLYLQVLSYSAF